MKDELIFYYNGIKDQKGAKLQKCWYCKTQRKEDNEAIMIYKCEYGRFSDLVRKNFEVKNDTDIMTDYFEKDRIKVTLDHPLYSQVLKALNDASEKAKKKNDKWLKSRGLAA